MEEDTYIYNIKFDEEVAQYRKAPPCACDRKTARKLLAAFECACEHFCSRFWPEPVEKYLPAVAEGTMFLGQELYEHAEALKIARQRADEVSYNDVANAFVYGVARGVPAYRTALPAYLHIKNIPVHGDEYLKPVACDTSPCCTFCNYSAASVGTKMSFLWINLMQYYREYLGGYLGMPSPESSSFLLREFAKMPKVTATKEDYQRLIDSLKPAEQLPPNKKIGAYKEILQKSKILPLKIKELPSYLDILGYLDILHTDEHRGITKKYIRIDDMKGPEESKNDYGYPVRFWRAKNGVDWDRVHELFDDAILGNT